MRKIILNKLKEIKSEQEGFSGKKWDDFRIGDIQIKNFDPNGLQNEMLVDYYTEVIKWNHGSNLFMLIISILKKKGEDLKDGYGSYLIILSKQDKKEYAEFVDFVAKEILSKSKDQIKSQDLTKNIEEVIDLISYEISNTKLFGKEIVIIEEAYFKRFANELICRIK